MKRIRKIVFQVYFQIGVNIIGLPEFHRHDVKKKMWVTMLLCIVIASCGKRPVENTENVQDIQHSSYTSLVERNKAISDQFTLFIPKVFTGKPECDSVTQATLDNVLLQLNARKQSGDNSYKMGYNAAKREFTLQTQIGATENKSESKSDVRIFLVKQKTTQTITKTPDFMRYSAYAGWLFALILIIKAYKKISTIWLPKTPIT